MPPHERMAENFTGRVEMEGVLFIDCNFRDCTIVFTGMHGGGFRNCDFHENVSWEFAGPAGVTADMLRQWWNEFEATPFIDAFIRALTGDDAIAQAIMRLRPATPEHWTSSGSVPK